MHVHYLPHLSLSYARHTNALNQTFIFLSGDYTKSLHLQTDRSLEFHMPSGLHYTTRLPRYGRDLKYNKRAAEVLIPAVGVNDKGNGEVFRLNLEIGRFMKGYEVDVGGDDYESMGGGALQGGINTGSVNAAAIAEESHNMLAFGTSLGTVEFWDSRSRSRVSMLGPPRIPTSSDLDGRPEITALTFHRSGLNLATGTSTGLVSIYDLRSPVPLLQKEQGYDFPIQDLQYLESDLAPDKIMSADKRIIKIWDAQSGDAWTSVEPAADLNHVEWIPKSGMFLTANEGRQQHAFLVPQLGPAPKWCAFLDNLVEEMAEDGEDPSAYKSAGFGTSGAVYDNYKFLSTSQLRELNMDHLIGQTSLLRPYMHGYFVAQKLYEQARLISNPDMFLQQREKSIQEKITKERESRIRGSKAVKVKVNRRLAEKMVAREEANERRKARRVLKQGGDEPQAATNGNDDEDIEIVTEDVPASIERNILGDSRFSKLFEDEDFEIDETSREFALQNPSTIPNGGAGSQRDRKRGLTAVEAEELASNASDDNSSSQSDDSEAEETQTARQRQRQRIPTETTDNNASDKAAADKTRISSSSYRKSGHQSQRQQPQSQSQLQSQPPRMVVSSTNSRGEKSTKGGARQQRDTSFGARAAGLSDRTRGSNSGAGTRAGVGEKEISFMPAKVQKRQQLRTGGEGGQSEDNGRKVGRGKERRSASGNTFRKM